MAECKRCGAIGAREYTRAAYDVDGWPRIVTSVECACGWQEHVSPRPYPRAKPGPHARGWLWLGLAMAIAAACRWM